jgi:hypothetical protein
MTLFDRLTASNTTLESILLRAKPPFRHYIRLAYLHVRRNLPWLRRRRHSQPKRPFPAALSATLGFEKRVSNCFTMRDNPQGKRGPFDDITRCKPRSPQARPEFRKCAGGCFPSSPAPPGRGAFSFSCGAASRKRRNGKSKLEGF